MIIDIGWVPMIFGAGITILAGAAILLIVWLRNR